jgi:tetratricopeptide (TPR) repeat protein
MVPRRQWLQKDPPSLSPSQPCSGVTCCPWITPPAVPRWMAGMIPARIPEERYSSKNNKGVALLKLGDYGAALSTFDDIIKANPYNSLAFYNKALSLLYLGLQNHDIGDINLALQSDDKVLRFNPDDKSALGLRTSLGDLLAWDHGQGH